MFSFRRLKNKKDTEVITETKNIDEYKYDIYLETIFNVMKYGDIINLDIKNKDIYEREAFLALRRVLILEGIEVSISQWADWTISVKLIDGNENLIVAEYLVPDSKVNWEKENNFVIGNPKIRWVQNGSWQRIIADKFNYLEQCIKDTIVETELEKNRKTNEEKLREERKNEIKRNYFENTYRNK